METKTLENTYEGVGRPVGDIPEEGEGGGLEKNLGDSDLVISAWGIFIDEPTDYIPYK